MNVRAKRKNRDEAMTGSRKMIKIDENGDEFFAIKLGGDASESMITDTKTKSNYIAQLPAELMNEIGLFCDGNGVVSSACVSKQWKGFFTKPSFWELKLEENFNINRKKFRRFVDYVDDKFPQYKTKDGSHEALAKRIFLNLEKLFSRYNLLPTYAKYTYKDPLFIPPLLACMSNISEYALDIIPYDSVPSYFHMALAANCKEVALALQKSNRFMPKDNSYLSFVALSVGNISLVREIAAQPLDAALHLAIKQNQKDVIEFLLQLSVDGKNVFFLDEESLRIAAENPLPDMFDFLEKKYSEQFRQHLTCCYQLASSGNPWAINYYKCRGFDDGFPVIPTLENLILRHENELLKDDKLHQLSEKKLYRLLKYAASCGNNDAFKKILNCCASKTNKPVGYFVGLDSLNLAAASDNLETFAFIIMQGAKPDMSTLRCAASVGARETIDFLLDEKNKFGLVVDASVLNCLVLSNQFDLLLSYYDKCNAEFGDQIDDYVVQSNNPKLVSFVLQRRSFCLDIIETPLYPTGGSEAAQEVIKSENLLRGAIASLLNGEIGNFKTQMASATWHSLEHVYCMVECILLNPSKYMNNESLKEMLKLAFVRKTSYINSILKLLEYASQGLMDLSNDERQEMFKLADIGLYIEHDFLREKLNAERKRKVETGAEIQSLRI